MTIEFSTLFSEFGLWLWKTFRFSRGTVSTVRYNPLRCTEYSVLRVYVCLPATVRITGSGKSNVLHMELIDHI